MSVWSWGVKTGGTAVVQAALCITEGETRTAVQPFPEWAGAPSLVPWAPDVELASWKIIHYQEFTWANY